ncbi:MAG: aminopeptidase P family protein [Deltaproteobacteria bacterium]|uniref:Aminopeptidase P family protein n=1 Tax=Candidatus Zymogenus saltonus TaxID=2844893 RepID=A0A9D8KJ09_9DELT|nr:aminopeptidase P family protein [Candidatus Zymogenus saltonus]
MTKLPEPITSPPTEEELASRVEKIRAKMDEKGYDYCVSFDPVNIYYLTNFANLVHERPFILIIPKKGKVKMVCPLLETSHVKARARLPLDYKIYYEFPAPEGGNWFDIYRAEIDGSASVAVESAMPVGIYNKTPGKIVVDDIIDDVRLVKTKYEIGRTVHGCQVVDGGHEKLLELTRPGAMEIAIYGDAVRAMMGKVLGEIPEANLIVTRLLAAVWPPSISHDPHRIPKPFMPMEEGGPQVSIVAGQVDGYGVEVERTFFLGKVPESAKRPFETMMEARALAYKLAVPGARFSDIDKKVRKVIIDAGYEDYILHRTGHGMGITGHEAPFLAIGDDREIVPDMIISIEPGIYIEGQGGFRHSDTVLITQTGNVRLTKTPDTLSELTIPL